MSAMWKKVVLVGVVLFLGGCVSASSERRGADSFVEDNWVAWKIRSAYVNSEKVAAGNINVSVYNGKVLLTGTAVSQEEIADAIAIAKSTRGVLDVDSELVVQYMTAGEIAEDVWITNQVKVKLLADLAIAGFDVHVETTNKVVFLTGVAKTVAERDKAIGIAQSVKGVAEVVSYIEVEGSPYPPPGRKSIPKDSAKDNK
ncbi:MAG: transport-associated protein [Magnetococcales bacterium]|nr:transport-associated protein [Magnetococcales bacterium]HIJ85151.1 BON domain-containing protein [Magnetococcales bacterium]